MNDYALSKLNPGPYPGRPQLFPGSYPGSSNLFGPYPSTPTDISESRPIVATYVVAPWPDGSHLTLQPGDLCFAARSLAIERTENELELSDVVQIVDISKLNRILRQGYLQSLPRWLNRVGKPSAGMGINIGPSEAELFLIDEYDKIVTPNYRQEHMDLEQTARTEVTALRATETPHFQRKHRQLTAMMGQAVSEFNVFSESKLLDKDGLMYLTLGSIVHMWSFIGVAENTANYADYARGDTSWQTAVPMVNVVIQKTTQVSNRWSNTLMEGAHLYLILKRRRADDGTYHEFQIIPSYSNEASYPPLQQREYRDLSGDLCYGKVWYVGSVHHKLLENRSDTKRLISLGLGETTEQESYDAKGGLDLIDVQVRV